MFRGFIFFFLDLFIYLRRGEEEGKGEKESQADALLRVQPHVGLDLKTLRSGPEPESRVGRLTD